MSSKTPFSALAFTLMRLRALAADGNQARLKFESSFDKDPVYAIEWLANTPKALIAANFATVVADKCKDKSEEDQRVILKNMLDELTRRIETWTPPTNSSSFHAAVENERLLALREVRNTVSLYLADDEE